MDNEQSRLDVEDWQALEPSLLGGILPEVEKAVDRMNVECSMPAVPSPEQTLIGQLLEDLNVSNVADPGETPPLRECQLKPM